MKIRLNLATSPLTSDRRFIVGSTTVGILGMLAMVVLAWHAFEMWRSNIAFRTQELQLNTEMNRLREERGALEIYFNQPETVQRRDVAAFFNNLIAERAFPWTKIFMDLEKNLPPGARVISVEPTLVRDHVELQLTVEASNDAAKLELLRDLEKSPDFSQIQLLSERRSEQAGDNAPIVLSLVARYSVT
jgi:hypothetical protein